MCFLALVSVHSGNNDTLLIQLVCFTRTNVRRALKLLSRRISLTSQSTRDTFNWERYSSNVNWHSSFVCYYLHFQSLIFHFPFSCYPWTAILNLFPLKPLYRVYSLTPSFPMFHFLLPDFPSRFSPFNLQIASSFSIRRSSNCPLSPHPFLLRLYSHDHSGSFLIFQSLVCPSLISTICFNLSRTRFPLEIIAIAKTIIRWKKGNAYALTHRNRHNNSVRYSG